MRELNIQAGARSKDLPDGLKTGRSSNDLVCQSTGALFLPVASAALLIRWSLLRKYT